MKALKNVYRATECLKFRGISKTIYRMWNNIRNKIFTVDSRPATGKTRKKLNNQRFD